MNLKFRNILISVGVVSLIGIATAGLIVSIQTHKEAQKDKDTKEMLSRPEIALVVSNAYNIVKNANNIQKTDDRYKELATCLPIFYSMWFTLGMPDEKDFTDFNPNLEPSFVKLQNLVEGLQGPTALSNAHDVRDVINNAWELFETPPANMLEEQVKVWQANLKDALQKFEKKWTENGYPDENEFAEIDKNDQSSKPEEKLGKLFENLKGVMVVVLMPYIQNP